MQTKPDETSGQDMAAAKGKQAHRASWGEGTRGRPRDVAQHNPGLRIGRGACTCTARRSACARPPRAHGGGALQRQQNALARSYTGADTTPAVSRGGAAHSPRSGNACADRVHQKPRNDSGDVRRDMPREAGQPAGQSRGVSEASVITDVLCVLESAYMSELQRREGGADRLSKGGANNVKFKSTRGCTF